MDSHRSVVRSIHSNCHDLQFQKFRETMSFVSRSLIKYSPIKFYSYSLKMNGNIISGRMRRSLGPHEWNYYFGTETRTKETNYGDQLLERLTDGVKKQGRVSICEVENLLDKLKTIGSVSPLHAVNFIDYCGQFLTEESPEERRELARKTFQFFEHIGAQLTIDHYNTVLSLYTKNVFNFVPDDILDVLRRNNIEPNQTTYQLLIFGYCRIGNMDKAFCLFELMKSEQIPINVQTFNVLIQAYSNSNDSNRMENLMRTMEEMSIESNNETYIILIGHYIEQGYIQKAEKLLIECEKRIELRNEDYLDIIYTFGKFGYEHKANELFSRIEKNRNFDDGMQNLVSRFVSDGKIESTFEMLDMMRKFRSLNPPDFVSLLIGGKVPFTAFTKLFEKLKIERKHVGALNTAMEASLRSGDEKKTLNLFKCAKALKLPVRLHYFWPLLIARGKTNFLGLYDLLRIMRDEFNVSPDAETIREYVIPYLLSEKPDINSILLRLNDCGCSMAIGVGSVVINLLRRGDLQTAANIAQSYKTFLPVNNVKKPLIESYLITKDARSFVILLSEIIDGVLMREQDTSDVTKIGEIADPVNRRKFVGRMIKKLTICLRRTKRVDELETILKEMEKRNIGLDAENGEIIQNMILEHSTKGTTKLIHKLTSSDFDIKYSPQQKSAVSGTPLHEQTLEHLYESMKANKESTVAIKKQLFLTYGRNKNLLKLLKMKEELEAEGFVFLGGMHSFVIDAYVEYGKCDEALKTHEQMRVKMRDFNLDAVKLLRFVSLLVQNGHVEIALDALKGKRVEIGNRKNAVSTDVCAKLCDQILKMLVERGNGEYVRKFFDTMVLVELMPLSNVLAGPLVAVHLNKNDADAALQSFCECCEKYSLTPWKNELARVLITSGDKYQLQKLIDWSLKIHGTSSTLHDMLQLFIEEGLINDAKKILQNPSFALSNDRIYKLGHQYSKERALKYLKNMLEVFEGVENVDRVEIFHDLLTIYDKTNDHEEALKLWKQMQDERVAPTRNFRHLLLKILRRNNMNTPLTITQETISSTDPLEIDEIKHRNDFHLNLMQYFSVNDFEGAIKLVEKYDLHQLSQHDLSLLMEMCLREKSYDEAIKLFEKFFTPKNIIPIPKVFKFLLKTAMRYGDVDFIKRFGNISEEERKMLSYDNCLCRAHVNAGKEQEYLNCLERRLDETKNNEEFRKYIETFPVGGISTCLLVNPALEKQIERILEKCRQKDSKLIFPDNIMWSYFMSTKQFEKAQLIWDSSLAPRKEPIIFEKLAVDIQRHQDVELGENLLKMLSSKTNISRGALGIAYSVLISALVQKNRIRDALNLLDVAVMKVSIEKMVVANLVTLKAACHAKHMLFRYTLPSTNRKSTLQSNTADDEFF